MMLGHMVYFALKDRSPAAVEKLLAGAKKHLTGHPGTVFFAVGVVAADLNRPVNQTDFDVALQLIFASRQAHDEYQSHARHVAFVEEQKANWDRVRVFDANVTC